MTGSRTTTTSTTGTGGCTATYRVANSWPGGFQGEVVVTNTGTSPIAGWTVGWTFPGGQSVAQAWNASVSQSGAAVSLSNASWNGGLGGGASTTAGFIGSGTAATPTGLTCSVR